MRNNTMIAGIDQHELLDPELLSDPDSCFSAFNGVKIHHKVCDCDADKTVIERQRRRPMVLLHGFGASLFSWNKVMKPLSELSGSKVLAFDRPAFGFTSRTMDPNSSGSLNPYSMAYSVLSTLFFVNYLGAEKTILVGHSFGSIVAVNTYFKAPERFAALILVDPAIVALFTSGGIAKEKNKYRLNNNVLKRIYNFIEAAIIQIVKWIVRILAAILQSTFGIMLARFTIDKLGIAIINFAWHDWSRVSEHTVGGYTKPLRCKGWDRGAVEFMATMLLDFTDHEIKPVPTKPLSEISCPVLIITGDNDRITPSWNSKRLSKAIPGSVYEVIEHCGHIPQEEKPKEFISTVQRFLQRDDVSM